MTWRVYGVHLAQDPESSGGVREILTEIPINETMPTYTSSMLNVPPLSFEYGIHKLVFRIEVRISTS